MNHFARLTILSLFVLTTACAARNRLQMGGLHSEIARLSGLEGDPLEKTPVEYDSTGKPEYDDFFKNAAVVNAELIVSNALVEVLTKNLKSFARSQVASGAADDSLKALLNGHSADEMDADEAVAVLKLQSQRGKLGADVKEYAGKTAGSTLEAGNYLVGSVVTTKGLAEKGKALGARVQSDFTGLDAPKVPGITSALATSAGNLTQATTTAPAVAKQLLRLAQGLMSL